VILRTAVHPAAGELLAGGQAFVSCDHYYEQGGSFREIYENIADFVLAEAMKHQKTCYCVPGHPLVAEDTVKLLWNKAAKQVKVRILPALSFLDAVFVLLGIDPVQEGLTLADAALLTQGDRPSLPAGSCLFTQVYDRFIAGELKLFLLERLSPAAETLIAHHAGVEGEEKLILCPLAELDHFKEFDHLTSVYLPMTASDGTSNRAGGGGSGASGDGGVSNLAGQKAGCDYPLDPLVEVFDRLLGPGGCPWDQKQTHETLKPYLIEEANEVLEAIDEKDMSHFKEELGDVLMQIVFHSALARGRGDFDINDVIGGVTEKLIRRHPHVFGEAKAENPEEVAVLWQRIKAEEKRKKSVKNLEADRQ
jgi:tetrapyrrole methylase family protein/MazG family protein